MRTMYDSVTATDIPVEAGMVAGYVDGRYAWSSTDWLRFPVAVKVAIAVSPFTDDGTVLDIEPGDSTPEQAVDWVLMRRNAGVDPSVYCSASNWQNVINAFNNRGVAQPHYWIAAWDGNASVPDGAVAKQYANSDMAGGHYDLSAVLDNWPGVDGIPSQPSQPSQPTTSGDLTVDQFNYLLAQISKVAAAVNVALDTPPGTSGRTYTVQPGDSLSAIAQHYLGDASRWPQIYDLNKDTIGPDPNVIQPGQVLTLPNE